MALGKPHAIAGTLPFWDRLIADDRSDDAHPVWREALGAAGIVEEEPANRSLITRRGGSAGSHSPYSPLALSRYGRNPSWKSEPPCRFWLGAFSSIEDPRRRFSGVSCTGRSSVSTCTSLRMLYYFCCSSRQHQILCLRVHALRKIDTLSGNRARSPVDTIVCLRNTTGDCSGGRGLLKSAKLGSHFHNLAGTLKLARLNFISGRIYFGYRASAHQCV